MHTQSMGGHDFKTWIIAYLFRNHQRITFMNTLPDEGSGNILAIRIAKIRLCERRDMLFLVRRLENNATMCNFAIDYCEATAPNSAPVQIVVADGTQIWFLKTFYSYNNDFWLVIFSVNLVAMQ